MPRTLHQGLSRDPVYFLKKAFSIYYGSASLVLPEDFSKREFAYQPIGGSSYIRHLSFKSIGEVRDYFKKNPPLHAYYSSAIYMFPEIPDMEQKKWLGSNLIFDIDADHIPSCMGVEQLYVCKKCGYNMRGFNISRCVNCGSEDVVEVELLPDECIKEAANEALKLYEVLRKDFGISDVKIYFSGNRGFHLHTNPPKELMIMSSEERREIVDYLKGAELDANRIILMSDKRRQNLIIPNPEDPGWRGRVGGVLYREFNLDFKKNYTFKELKNLGFRGSFEEFIEKAKIHVDEKVTIDIHRLVRIPGSLNGKTGLPVIEVKVGELKSFRISYRLSPFKGKVEVKLLIPIKESNIMGYDLSGDRGDKIVVPQPIAIYLMLRSIAEPVGVYVESGS